MTNAELQIAIDAIRNATADGSITNVMEADIMDALKSNNIPLSGTTEGNPVTGDIELSNLDHSVSLYSGNKTTGQWRGIRTFKDEHTFEFVVAEDNIERNIFLTYNDGFISNTDYSDSIPENKLIYAQRSYVERPETLITALTNCDSTQLDEIKTILGII